MSEVESVVVAAARRAREIGPELGRLSLETRNVALLAVAEAYDARRDEILATNAADIRDAEALAAEGKLSPSLVKRLSLAGSKLDDVITGLRAVADLPDPIGEVQAATEMDEGLHLFRVSCPIGVICTIFESRPDALPQIASLCLKSGNAILLKGGSEAARTNRILGDIFAEATVGVGAPEGWIHLLESREEVGELLALDQYIDLIIPRGGNELVQSIMNNTRIPVTGHQDGVCHVYIHSAADPEMAVKIAVDSKCQYPSVCNAAETLLVDDDIAIGELEAIVKALTDEGVTVKGCGRTRQILNLLHIEVATEDDWSEEYLDLVISICIVKGMNEAVAHINRYGSQHTDSIVTEDAKVAEEFIRRVDSSSVMHNASTRFADGYRYGLGAEVGISTNKIHSRGPVGLEGLTIYKYVVRGDGHVVSEYSGADARSFTHRPLPM